MAFNSQDSGPSLPSWSAPIAAVKYLRAALTLASNHGLGMAIAEFDLAYRPACSIELAEKLSLRGSRRTAALCTDTDTHIARSEPPSPRD